MHYSLKRTFTTLLLLTLIIGTEAQPIDREQFKLREQTIDFMHGIASDLEQLPALDANPGGTSEAFEKLHQLPALQKINAHLSANRETYLSVRKRAFEQLSPPPPGLDAVVSNRPDSDEIMQLLMKAETAAAINSYSYTPRQIATLINNLTYSLLVTAYTEDIRELVSVVHSFGSRVYGEPSGDGKWSCWWANRRYCIAFEFDLTTSSFNNIRYSTPGDPAYTHLDLPDTARPTYTVDSLIEEMHGLRWQAYHRTVEGLPHYLTLQEAEQNLAAYYESEKQRFQDVRVAALTLFSPFEQPDSSIWVRQVPDAFKQDLIHDTEQSVPRYEIDTYEVSTMLIIQSAAVFSADEKPDYSRSMINQAAGYRHSASQIADDTWKIWAEGIDQAVEYRWNVKEGTVEGTRYYKKRKK